MVSEQLKPEEFDAHIQNGTFRLAFVGMSNAGKSYRSRVLQKELDFLWYQVDEAIQNALGFNTLEEVSAWLGLPTSTAYQEREQEYFELENKFTKQASMQTKGKNFVFDTTGSVVHLKPETIRVLQENCLVVHFDVGEHSIDKMFKEFFREPKPVAWAGFFDVQPGESEEAALRRSYPILLRERLRRYRALSHMSIPVEELRDKSAKETLSAIRSHL